MNKNATPEEISATLNRLIDSTNDNFARLSAQRYLIEQLYANAFISDPSSLQTMLDGMIQKTLSNSTFEDPMDQEAMRQQSVRTAQQLEKFRDGVLLRIQQGRVG